MLAPPKHNPTGDLVDYEELMAMYRDSLRDKRGVVERLWSRLRGDDGGEAEVAALRSCLHHLAGSAGSYGYPLLGENARRLERALASWLATTAELRTPSTALARRHLGDFEEVTHALDMAIGTESA